MILRAMGLGFLLWLAVAAVFRFAGQMFFLPDARLMSYLSAPVVAVLVTLLLLKLLHEARGDEGEAAIGIALPTLFLNGFMTHEFAATLPNIDPTLDGAFGAWSLLFCGSILMVGLFQTQLAPQDERV